MSPFSFREREINYTPETGNVFGQEACFEVAFRKPESYDQGSCHFMYGLGVQWFEYTSSNDEDLMLSKHGISNMTTSSTYFYQKPDNSYFQFDRKFLGFGAIFGVDFTLRKRFSLNYLLMLGAMSSSVQYDAENSFGINWPKVEPSGFQNGGLLFFSRMTFGLFYKLN